MKKALKILPFKTERCVIKAIGYEDISWYVDTIKQTFFNEFVDGKSSDNSDMALTGKLVGLISSYKIGLSGRNEIRAIITIDGKPVGGITIFHASSPGSYDLGYWVIPEYQGRGIAFEVLKGMTNKLEFNVRGLKLLRLIVRVDNVKSIRLSEKAGYKLINSYQGKEKENLVYGYTPLKFG